LDGRNSIHTQSYGSASRGALTKSDVQIADTEIHDLVCDELDVLVTMSQQSYDEYRACLTEGGVLCYESDMVEVEPVAGARVYGAGVTDIAFKTFGRKIMANMIMVGFANGIARMVSEESLLRTVTESVPSGTEKKNIGACREGMRLARLRLQQGH
jgi:2-oxoglutarate ferredoxin oxidoreductase subunit gamma